MFFKIKESIKRYATVKTTLFFLLVTNLLYGAMLTITIPAVHAYSGGLKILDLLPMGYSASYVQNLFEALGTEGRGKYLYEQIPLDTIYPALFAFTYSFLTMLIVRRIFPNESKFEYLCFVPLVAGLFDYAENVGIISMLTLYPDFEIFLADLTNFATITKSIVSTVAFSLIIIGAILVARKKIKTEMVE